MDANDHYERACELAAQADEEWANAHDAALDSDSQQVALQYADTAARMAHLRFMGAWVAYMGADIKAAAQLAEDAKADKDWPDLGVTDMKGRRP